MTARTAVDTHLGIDAMGNRAAAYQTPDHIDHDLLVAVYREENRIPYALIEGDLPFVGVDVWNAYEFSALTNNGFPVVGQVKIAYPAGTQCIVESKSLKLYLNSFNMVSLGPTPKDVLIRARTIIENDLRWMLGSTCWG